MSAKHETKFHAPIGQEGEAQEAAAESPGVTVCEAHQAAFLEVFASMKGYMSRVQTVWTIGVLSAVAVFYGVTLWTTVSSRCSESETRINAINDESKVKIEAIRNQATIQEVKLQYIEDTVRELKTGQKETLARIEELRRELQKTNKERL